MKKSEVQLGVTYVAKVSGKITTVRIVSESQYGGWNAVNLATTRGIRIYSAQRLHRRIDTDRLEKIRNLRSGGMTFDQAREHVDREEQAIRDAAQDMERAQ